MHYSTVVQSQPLLIWPDIIATVGSVQELALICYLGRFFCSIKPFPQRELIFSRSGTAPEEERGRNELDWSWIKNFFALLAGISIFTQPRRRKGTRLRKKKPA